MRASAPFVHKDATDAKLPELSVSNHLHVFICENIFNSVKSATSRFNTNTASDATLEMQTVKMTFSIQMPLRTVHMTTAPNY